MKKEKIEKEVDVIVEELLNNGVYNNKVFGKFLDEDIEWDENGRVGKSNEEKVVEYIIENLKNKLSYY
jgi:hypothetical protein